MLPLRFPHLNLWQLRSVVAVPVAMTIALLLDCAINVLPAGSGAAEAQTAANRALTLRSDVQEANARTGVVTARGNVQINYPARQIQATAAQAQYFSKERRIVLSGNVYVLQQGNSMRGETITYLIDEGRFVALPLPPKQVESIYLLPEDSPLVPSPTATPTPFGDQPELQPPGTTPLPPAQP